MDMIDLMAGPAMTEPFSEEEYNLAEREGLRLDSILCVDCPDPGLCAAEGECPREEA